MNIKIAIVLSLLFPLCCITQAKENSSNKSIINYYTDAYGIFTIQPPSDSVGYSIKLHGTCELPEILIKIQKKNSGLPFRQVAYRMKNSPEFNIQYIFKDGPGDYEIIIFGKKMVRDLTYNGLCSFFVRSMEEMPQKTANLTLNDKVLEYVESVMGKTVGSGECWDLAQEALDVNGADWTRPVIFGAQLDIEKDQIKAGDIIQFKSVRLESKLPNGGKMWQTLGAPDHTAIIIGIEGKKKYKIAHQNTDGKRYVIMSIVDLNIMTSGRYWIYRPLAGILK